MSAKPLELARCTSCGALYVPGESRCPRCAGSDAERASSEPLARVLAAVELLAPSAGWSAPHPLLLVELENGVRLLATTGEARRPVEGSVVVLTRDGEIYRASAPA